MARKSTTPSPKPAKSPLSGLLHGRWLSSRFFSRNWGVVLTATVMIIFYIATRYQCLAEMEEIQKLEHKLSVIHSEQVRERALYMSNTRETVMSRRIEELGLDLKVRERPPYHITLID